MLIPLLRTGSLNSLRNILDSLSQSGQLKLQYYTIIEVHFLFLAPSLSFHSLSLSFSSLNNVSLLFSNCLPPSLFFSRPPSLSFSLSLSLSLSLSSLSLSFPETERCLKEQMHGGCNILHLLGTLSAPSPPSSTTNSSSSGSGRNRSGYPSLREIMHQSLNLPTSSVVGMSCISGNVST